MIPAAIVLFFVGHWTTSVFFQTFFLHRYGAHKMFTMSKGWERVFYLLTYLTQGSSFLVPRGYALLHRMHHAYSDTDKDPHSPVNFKNAFAMMWDTKKKYHDLAYRLVQPEAKFEGGYPEWSAIDRIGQSWVARIAWGALYTLFYIQFATAWWQFALVPIHWVMGPIHGLIVNWCGHRYGYKNFKETRDESKNTLVFDFLTLGELFQNNHHKYGQRPNFGVRWFEIDPAYLGIRVMAWLRIIRFTADKRAAESPAPILAEPENA